MLSNELSNPILRIMKITTKLISVITMVVFIAFICQKSEEITARKPPTKTYPNNKLIEIIKMIKSAMEKLFGVETGVFNVLLNK